MLQLVIRATVRRERSITARFTNARRVRVANRTTWHGWSGGSLVTSSPPLHTWESGTPTNRAFFALDHDLANRVTCSVVNFFW